MGWAKDSDSVRVAAEGISAISGKGDFKKKKNRSKVDGFVTQAQSVNFRMASRPE
jgi:hypothetical protein